MKRRGAGNRKQQIARALENLLSAEGIAKNINIVSALKRNEFLNLQDLLYLRHLSSLNTQLWEIQNYIAESPTLSNYLTDDPMEIRLPFQITFTKLRIHQFSQPTTLEEMKQYVFTLNGRDGINQVRYLSHCFCVDFQSVNNCLAFWRATKLVPFKGQCLHCEIFLKKYERKIKKSESIAPNYYRRANGPYPQHRNQEMHDMLRKHLSTPPPQPVRPPLPKIEKPEPKKSKIDLVIMKPHANIKIENKKPEQSHDDKPKEQPNQ